jgi:hypothetical protein
VFLSAANCSMQSAVDTKRKIGDPWETAQFTLSGLVCW